MRKMRYPKASPTEEWKAAKRLTPPVVAAKREDAAWIEQRLHDPDTLFVPVWRNRNLVAGMDAGTPEAVYLSGETAAVQEAEQLALAAGARRALILTIPLPAHTPLMAKAAAAFRKVVDKLPLKTPSIPILANATGEAMRTVASLQEELRQQMLRQVDWARTMVSMRTMEVRTVVELGPGRVLASLAAKHIPGVDTWNAEELFIDFADPAPA